MGQVRAEVNDGLLFDHPEHRDFLIPFLNGFFVTWGRRRREYNTELFVYFLSPEDHFKESYGFENEVLLVYAPYDRMEPRTFQAVEQILATSPAKGRVETLSYFLVTDAEDIEEWMESYISSRQESRVVIPFYRELLVHAKQSGDDWFVRNSLDKHFFGRDLFNYSLPLIDDAYFFGRQSLLMDYYDSIKQSENRAIFGLRKTGKTSFLYKLKRLCESEGSAFVFYYDCKVPHIRKSKWNELLCDIANDVAKKYGITIKGEYSERSASKDFEELVRNIYEDGEKIVLMLDEIEYISFVSPKNRHWSDDYIDFWQTMWSCQSQFKCISFILAGVNPTVVEKDSVDGVQNPLFGIVPHKYLTGLSQDEVKVMLKKLGKRMGMRFDSVACNEISKWYGGHPLLTRQACSSINSFLSEENSKPLEISKEVFLRYKPQVDRELVFYSDHAISEIRQFYPDEYFLFELLSIGQELEFKELSQESAEIKHLLGYQLIKRCSTGYEVNIPVIASRVALESKRGGDRELIYPIVESGNRESWLRRRVQEICSEIRLLEKLIKRNGKPLLFGANSFPEAEQLQNIEVSYNESQFSFFINVLNRCFVESIEHYGRDKGDSSYFWGTIKDEYQFLWSSLRRIKVYRNERDHLHLNDNVSSQLFEFLDEDLEGKRFSQVSEAYFVLQQRVLDRFLLSILREIDRFN